MDIVVKLPDKDYSAILTKIMLACNGCKITKLPEGHGPLTDKRALIPDSDYEDGVFYSVSTRAINDAPTLIEADSEDKYCLYVSKKQKTILDKIRAEIKATPEQWWMGENKECFVKLLDVLEIIDYYKAEREE